MTLLLLGSGAINLLPDQTFFVQLGIFLFTVLILRFFVIGPSLRIFQRRREQLEGNTTQAQTLTVKAEQLEQELATEIARARREALAAEERKRQMTEQEVRKELDAARAKARDRIETHRREILHQTTEVQGELAKEVQSLKTLLAERLMGGGRGS